MQIVHLNTSYASFLLLSFITCKVGSIIASLQSMRALNDIMGIKGPAQSLAQSTAQNISSITNTIMIVNTVNIYLEHGSHKHSGSWPQGIPRYT